MLLEIDLQADEANAFLLESDPLFETVMPAEQDFPARSDNPLPR